MARGPRRREVGNTIAQINVADVPERPANVSSLLQGIAPGIEVTSAGSHPKQLHPNTVRVLLEEFGIDISGRSPQHLDSVRPGFDHVITLCDKVREVCPEFEGTPIHWSVPEPSGYPEFVATAVELDTRIRHLLPVLARRGER